MPKDNTAYGPSSNPSSKSYAGGGGGGGVSTGKTTGGGNGGLGGLAKGLGITTGKTIFGNTAFGPAGGMAQGYATAQLGGGAGMKPTINTYSNFRNLDGSATLPAAGNATAMGRNPQQALSMLQSMFGTPRRVGGLLDSAQAPGSIVPTAAAIPIPRKRPLSALEQFNPWWRDPVSVKYDNPFTFQTSNPAVFSPQRVTQQPKSSLPPGIKY